ncbi:Gastrulation defective protein 1 like protein [Fasciola gigantica]|uniref:Gastrulation defective protein 1 like protein n=1 Tax=Fasciola gigantica TaxID=46835 RepID=A0A504Z9K9_FASGI|nr:Gastrulation defective protein 1 like protein [Fasciola gigantica]
MEGNKPKAKEFDFLKIFEEAHALAKERNYSRNIDALMTGCSSLGSQDDTKVTEDGDEQKKANDADTDADHPPEDVPDVEEVGRSPYHLPICDELTLCHGNKPLTALAVDPAGARIATGGLDFDVRLWDFGGMDTSCRPFKTIRPCEEHQIKHLEFSPSGEYLLAISGSAQAQVITRDGEPVCFTNKGFQYITDPASAKGHTHGLHWGCWHPLDSSKFLTCSQDCTLRIWDVNDAETLLNETKIPTHKSVLRPRNAQGRKVTPTTCSYSRDGQHITTGCQDGSIQMWDTRKPLVNTSQVIRTAHAPNSTITCIAWSWDARQLASRCTDDSLKLWDARALTKGPVLIERDLPVLFEQTEVAFSANDHLILTGVSAPRGDAKAGSINFYRRDNFKLIDRVHPGHGSVIRVLWHHRINQVFCASSDGTANVLYDPRCSHNGALMCANRQPSSSRRRLGAGEAFIKPYLLMYNEDSVRVARKNKKLLNAPQIEAQIAMAAANAVTQSERQAASQVENEKSRLRVPKLEEKLGNRVGSLHQYMVQQIVLQRNEAEERAEKDIRGAILRHADKAKAEPFWTKAYLKTQPNPVFHDPEDDMKKDDTPVWKKQKLA